MKSRDEQISEWLKREDEFSDLVLNDFESFRKSELVQSNFPNFGGVQMLSGTRTGSFKREFKLSNSYNNIYKASPYYYDKQNLLIHYTSLDNLFSIINENAIRLYDLKFTNDPQEIFFSFKNLDFNKTFSEYDLENLKNNLFNISFFEYKDENKIENFNHWRTYGKDGDGVILIFELFNSNMEYWNNVHFSKVYYGTDNDYFKNLRTITNEYNAFYDKYYKEDDTFINSPDFFQKLLAFHKNGFWEEEDETRLIFLSNNFQNSMKEKYYELNKFKKVSSYIKMPLYNYNFSEEFKDKNATSGEIFIKLKKVILGYRYNEDEFVRIKDEYLNLCQSVDNEFNKGNTNRFPYNHCFTGTNKFERSIYFSQFE